MMNLRSLLGLRLGCGGECLILMVVDSRLRGNDGLGRRMAVVVPPSNPFGGLDSPSRACPRLDRGGE